VARSAKPKPPPPPTGVSRDALDKAPKTNLGPAAPVVLNVWGKDNKFHIIKLPATKTVAKGPDGSNLGEIDTVSADQAASMQAQMSAQVSVADTNVVPRAPTPAEIEASTKAADAENAKGYPAPSARPAGDESTQPGPKPGR